MDSATTTSILNSVTNSSNWQGALDAITRTAQARACSLLVREKSDFLLSPDGEQPYSLGALSENYRKMFEDGSGAGEHFIKNLAHKEEKQFLNVGRLLPGRVYRDEEMGIPKGVLDQREDYVHLLKHSGVLRRALFGLNNNNGWTDILALGFPKEVEYVSDDTVRTVLEYLPFLSKSVEIGRTFGLLKDRYNAILTVLDHLNFGIALALGTGEIILANAESKRIFEARDGVRLNRFQHVEASLTDQTAELKRYIQQTALTSRGEDSVAFKHLALKRPSGGHPLLLEVVPIRDAEDELNTQLRGAILIIIDPEKTDPLNIEKFASLYILTKAETQVCDLLLKGHTAQVIAEIRGTSFETARSQIRSVYGKTGAESRGNLVRLIVRTLPPVI